MVVRVSRDEVRRVSTPFVNKFATCRDVSQPSGPGYNYDVLNHFVIIQLCTGTNNSMSKSISNSNSSRCKNSSSSSIKYVNTSLWYQNSNDALDPYFVLNQFGGGMLI